MCYKLFNIHLNFMSSCAFSDDIFIYAVLYLSTFVLF